MILVFGSINIDLVTRVARIPAPGETVLGSTYDVIPGGKGANQALAAARAGADVALIGAIGADGFGETALALLREAGVDLAGVRLVDQPTGAAFISVDAHGRNAITVASGANAAPAAEWIDDAIWSRATTLLLQREAPAAATLVVAREAKRRGVRVIMNAAPADDFDAAILGDLDLLIVNEHEAAAIASALDWPERAPADIVKRLDRERGLAAIATLGGDGVVATSRNMLIAFAAPKIDVVDTTAAGDSFCGALAAALDRGESFETALRQGVAAGSLACSRPGAQPSAPYRAEIEAMAKTLASR